MKRKIIFTNFSPTLISGLEKLFQHRLAADEKLQQAQGAADVLFSTDRSEILRTVAGAELEVEVVLFVGTVNEKKTAFTDDELVSLTKQSHQNTKVITYSHGHMLAGSDAYINRGLHEEQKQTKAQELFLNGDNIYREVGMEVLFDIDVLDLIVALLIQPEEKVEDLIHSLENAN